MDLLPNKRSFTKFFGLLFLIAQIPSVAFAHGEDKPGPHGGFIRMPGAFHTEVVRASDKKINVYLLDTQWSNPTSKDSSVEATIKNKGKENKLSCVAKSDHFECDLPANTTLKKGELTLTASRQGSMGGAAVYKLPLQLVYE